MAIIKGVRTYKGSCHCGAVRYEADLDLSKGSGQCNCTICSKSGWWGILIKPDAFRLISGADKLVTLTRIPQADYPRCGVCGIQAFNRGNVPEIGGEFISINVRCLDGVDLEGLQITFHDGLHDTWAPLQVLPYTTPFIGAGQPPARA